jgi:hypothetical protein
MNDTLSRVIAGVALVLAVIALFMVYGVSHPGQKLGASGNAATVSPNPVWFTNGLQVGPTGTQLANMQFGTCSIIGAGAQTTGTLKTYDCPVSGVRTVDNVFGDAPPAIPAGLVLVYAIASTTPNYVTFGVYNASASTQTVPTTNWEYRTAR